ANAPVAGRVDVLTREEVRVLLAHIVVRVGPQPVGWVERAREIIEVDLVTPLVLPAPAGRRHQTLAAVAYGHVADHLEPDIALGVSIGDVERRRAPAARGGPALVRGGGAVDVEP